ncbi:hypothetical protein [Pantoea cypripedii]|uniref:Uncharacterized protein n=1 Tax=Pantoea cypripedii TaxID=55209 RepID=A0A1X1ELH6_PANCY|nr:hypothetical protein [Pantoea cypripedii]MBP2200213.1 membrane fusion protein [Pantoea cypripedii]ORM89808.1 hypothetical protein HA50_24735 [Pantoea cypripedii]
MEKPFFRKHTLESSGDACSATLSSALLFFRRNLFSLVIGTVSFIYFVESHQPDLFKATAKPLPQSQQITVSASTDGTVEQIPVTLGEHVTLKTPLVLFSNENRQALEGTRLVCEQLKLEQSSLLQDIQHTQQLALQQASDNRYQKDMLNGQLEQLLEQIKIESSQISMAQNLVNKWRPLLAKGYVSTLQFAQEQSIAWGYESQYRSLLQQQYGTRQQLIELNDQQLQLPLATAVKINVLRRQLAQVDESLEQNENTPERVVYTLSAGTVKSVFAKAGDTITTGQPLLTIEPDNQPGIATNIPHHKVSAHKV